MKRKMLLCMLLSLVLAFSLALPALAAGSFTDVPADAWYAEAADYCADEGILQGVGGGSFEPAAELTRAMVVTVLHRLSGSPAPAARGAFNDVPADAWYAEAADWAAEEGVARGVGDGRLAPNDAVLRQDLALFLWHLTGAAETEGTAGFTDEAAVSAYALDGVRWASDAGIVAGMDDGSFAPRAGATRAQFAVMLMRLDRSGILKDTAAMLRAPCGLALGEDGALLVTDARSHRIWSVRSGVITAYAGANTPANELGMPRGGYRDGALEQSLFREPWAITPFLDGWAVSDAGNNALRLITGGRVLTINGTPAAAGLAVSDMGVVYDRPTGLATDGEGRLYVADTGSGTIRRITHDGRVSVFARGLNEPTGLCWYGGSLYVAETGENRILRVTDGTVQVLAGTGEEGFEDGSALSATFRSPIGLAAGEDGTIYVADMVNSAVRSISGGQVRTLLSRGEKEAAPASPMGLLIQGDTLWVSDNYTGGLLSIPIN